MMFVCVCSDDYNSKQSIIDSETCKAILSIF